MLGYRFYDLGGVCILKYLGFGLDVLKFVLIIFRVEEF